MKKTLLSFILMVCPVLMFGQSQPIDSTSYFGNNACWSYKSNFWDGSGFFTVGIGESLAGDTLISGHVYKKFYGLRGIGSPRFELNKACVRQEGQKVYVKLEYQSAEFLLYDFSLSKGEVFNSTAQSGMSSSNPVVYDVDSVMMYNGKKLKRIVFGEDTWIEGIGSTQGFMNPFREFVTCDCNSSYELISFARDEHLKFYNAQLCANFQSCKGVIDALDNVVDEHRIEVFPNPVSDWLTVKFEANVSECTFELFDLQGRQVMQTDLSAFQNAVNVSKYQKGLYLYRLTSNGKLLQAGKIVKN